MTRPSGSPSWSASQDVETRAGFNYRAAKRATIQGYANKNETVSHSLSRLIFFSVPFFLFLLSDHHRKPNERAVRMPPVARGVRTFALVRCLLAQGAHRALRRQDDVRSIRLHPRVRVGSLIVLGMAQTPSANTERIQPCVCRIARSRDPLS